MTTPPRTVHRRHVFYLPGHDPAGGRRYREIYRSEARKQAEISGYRIEVNGLPTQDGRYRWAATAEIDGQRTEAQIEFLTWNDLVRGSLQKPLLVRYALMLRAFWILLVSGAFRGYWRVRPVMLFSTVYPFAVYLAVPLAGVLLGAVTYGVAAFLLPLPGWMIWPAMALGLAAAFAIFRRYDERYYVTYLMLSYAYFALNRGGKPDGLEARSKEFAERIAVSLAREDVDEVLIVGHSAGAGIGVRICAELLRQGRVPPGKLALLGIGSVTQVVSFLPRARWMRADLRMLAAAEDFTWVEVSAPSDGLCFAMSDPVATTGVDVPPEQKRWPVVFSAAFHNSLSEELRDSPEFTHFRKHFQYIHAFDRPRDYDYFQITAGPLRLADRYGDRPHSPSRVVRAVGPYRDY